MRTGLPLERNLARARRGMLYTVTLTVLAMVTMSYVIRVYDVVNAVGEVVPESSMVVVSTPDGGRVMQIFAAAGDHLEAGKPLVALDPNFAPDKLAAMQLQLNTDEDEKDRLEEAYKVVTQILAAPEMIRSESTRATGMGGDTFNLINDLYKARLELDGANEYRRINIQRQKDQVNSEISLVTRNIDALHRNLELSKKESAAREAALNGKRNDFEALLKLADKGLVSGTDVNRERDSLLSAELNMTGSRKQIDQIQLDISNSNLHISELKIQGEAASAESNNRLEAAHWQYDMRLARLGEHQTALKHLLQSHADSLTATRDKLRQGEGGAGELVIPMPVTGTITRLSAGMAGTLIKPGANIATILPEGRHPLVMAHLANKDVGFVHPGLTARIHIDAYPHQQYGTVAALVSHVFPDPEGPDFIVKLVLKDASIDVQGVAAPLFPGLQVHVDVLTRERPIADLFLHR